MGARECHNQQLKSTKGQGSITYLDLKEFTHLQQDGLGIVMLLLAVNTSLRGREKKE